MFYFLGINVFPLDSSSKFPLDYAKEYSHQQIAKVLEEAQGKFHWKQLTKVVNFEVTKAVSNWKVLNPKVLYSCLDLQNYMNDTYL
jgi:hypothetical protein